MCSKPQHDEIRVHAVETVAGVGVVMVRVGQALQADPIDDLVLSLAGHGGVAEDDGEVSPGRVVLKSILDVEVESRRNFGHERRAGLRAQSHSHTQSDKITASSETQSTFC